MKESKYNVFISYSRKDYVDDQNNVIPGNVVSLIKDALSSAGITYWFDEEGIYSGQNFVEKIVDNIEICQIFLFISTENANKSPWTCKEIACADEFNKHIIPIRIDKTPYNKKVLFRISDLDYIDYYTNPEKGLADLVASISAYLEQVKEEERRKQEEELQRKELERQRQEELRLQKEKEEKRIQEEQQKLIHSIKLSCKTLDNEEAKLELDRANLILQADGIIDEEQKEAIKKMISEGGALYKKFQTERDEQNRIIEELQSNKQLLEKDIDLLRQSIKEKEDEIIEIKKDNEQKDTRVVKQDDIVHQLEDQISKLNIELKDKQDKINDLEEKLDQAKSDVVNYTNKANHFLARINELRKQLEEKNGKRKTPGNKAFVFSSVILLASIVLFIVIVIWNNKQVIAMQSDALSKTNKELRKLENILSLTSEVMPFKVLNIEVSVLDDDNKNTRRARLEMNKSRFMSIKVSLIGFKKTEERTLCYKLIQPNGQLISKEESLDSYTDSKKIDIELGENSFIFPLLSGETIGFWRPGKYRIEIWSEDEKFAERTVEIR